MCKVTWKEETSNTQLWLVSDAKNLLSLTNTLAMTGVAKLSHLPAILVTNSSNYQSKNCTPNIFESLCYLYL